jgi:hypothetical protein
MIIRFFSKKVTNLKDCYGFKKLSFFQIIQFLVKKLSLFEFEEIMKKLGEMKFLFGAKKA